MLGFLSGIWVRVALVAAVALAVLALLAGARSAGRAAERAAAQAEVIRAGRTRHEVETEALAGGVAAVRERLLRDAR